MPIQSGIAELCQEEVGGHGMLLGNQCNEGLTRRREGNAQNQVFFAPSRETSFGSTFENRIIPGIWCRYGAKVLPNIPIRSGLAGLRLSPTSTGFVAVGSMTDVAVAVPGSRFTIQRQAATFPKFIEPSFHFLFRASV